MIMFFDYFYTLFKIIAQKLCLKVFQFNLQVLKHFNGPVSLQVCTIISPECKLVSIGETILMCFIDTLQILQRVAYVSAL